MSLNLRILYMFLILVLIGLPQVSLAANKTSHRHTTHHQAKKKVTKKKVTKKKTRRKSYPRKVTPVVVSPQNFNQAYLQFLRRWQVPGSSVAIIKNDKFILASGYGWADIETRRPMTPDSVFRIASVSKAVTAVAIMKLAQEGKINLDSKVYYILNDLQPLTNSEPRSRIYAISVRNLLEMSSGWITDHGIDPMLGAWSGRMHNQLQNQIPPDCRTAARMMMTIPMQYAPGTQYSYSNISYCMLGLIINKATGLSGAGGYEAYVQQQLLAPHGITSMRIGDNTPGRQQANEVSYYVCEPRCTTQPNIDSIHDGLPYGQTNLLQKNFSDGGWIASAPDLARFLHALGKHLILSSETMRVMTARPSFQTRENYFAKGWSIKHINGHHFMLKTGSFTGTEALVMLEDDGTAYAALFNAKPINRKLFLSQLQNMLIKYSHSSTTTQIAN